METGKITAGTSFYIRELEKAKGRIAELEQRLAEAEAKIPRWIPVTERLPKPGATILAVDNSGDMGVCTFVNAKFVGECFGGQAYLDDGGWDCSPSKVIGEYVTHWMPRPEKPESGKVEVKE